jgi:hypothetical protein
MNLDEKIDGRLEAKLEQLVQMFNEAPDTAIGNPEVGDYLRGSIMPLLQDIKTEVKQLQNNQVVPETEKQEPPDDPAHDPSPADPQLPDLRKAIRDAVKGVDKTKRLSSPMRKMLPSADDPIPEWIKDIPWYDIASDAYKLYKIYTLNKDINEKYGSAMDLWNQLKNGQISAEDAQQRSREEMREILDSIINILNTDIEDELARMFQLGQDMSQNMGQCCESMHQAQDEAISHIINLPSYGMNLANEFRGYL